MDPGMIAFIVIVSILIAGLIAAVIVLFLIKPNKTDNGAQGTQGRKGPQGFQGKGSQGLVGPIGPQNARGPQGFFGSQGLMGPQGSTQGATGPQGTPGTNGPQGVPGTSGSSNAIANRRVFTFTAVPEEDAVYFAGGSLTAAFNGAYTKIDNLVTMAFENVECVIVNPANPNFFFRITLPFLLNNTAAYSGFVFTNNSPGTDAVPIILQDITVLSGYETIRLRFLKTNGTPIWSGVGSNPLVRCFFTVTYLAA